MRIEKHAILLALLCLQIGCTEPYRRHRPAPVYGQHSGGAQTAVTTEPLQDTAPLSGEPIELSPVQPRPAPRSSPAVVALLDEAERSSKSGNLEGAVATVERALRIEPRNPHLVYRLAELRLQQGKPRLAEDLAKKSALLSAGNPALKKRCWLLIAEARKLQGNVQGAAEAGSKANRIGN